MLILNNHVELVASLSRLISSSAEQSSKGASSKRSKMNTDTEHVELVASLSHQALVSARYLHDSQSNSHSILASKRRK